MDLHIIRSHYFNAANEGGTNSLWTDPNAQETFLHLWSDLSARLKQYPVSMVASKLMNEPVAENPEDWNKLIEKGVKTIRALEPQRVLVIGSNMWQIPGTFPQLKIPLHDPNIILSPTYLFSTLFYSSFGKLGAIQSISGSSPLPGTGCLQ